MIDRKVSLVTGGSRGIGRAICVALGRLGHAVLINFNEDFDAAEQTRQLVEDAGGVGELCQADVSAKSHRDLLVEYTMDRFGRIDLLVNNAGIAPQVRNDILETAEESYDRVMAVNLKAPYFLTQLVARQMIDLIQEKRLDGGAIINVSSIRAYTVGTNYGEYCISKTGLGMVTRLFAVRLAQYGINVYEISPGVIKTDMTAKENVKTYYNHKLAAGLTPINRWGLPEEIGKAVSAIARGDFPFTTGAVFHVDGGWCVQHL